MKRKVIDVTVQEAAQLLNVTPRSILNYIRAKELEAVKVGKVWYIKKPSLDTFSYRFGLKTGVDKEQAPIYPPPALRVKRRVQIPLKMGRIKRTIYSAPFDSFKLPKIS